MWPGVRYGWIPIALALLVHVPGRRVFADYEAHHGRPGWQFFCAGLLADLSYVGPVLFLALVLPPVVTLLIGRRAGSTSAIPPAAPESVGRRATSSRAASFAGAVAAVAVLGAAWMFSVGAIEAKLERGLYPTFVETKFALENSSFVIGSLPTLLLDRYWKTSAVVLAITAAVLVFYWRRARGELSSGARVAGFALGAVVPFLTGFEVANLDRTFFPDTGGAGETQSPIEVVLAAKLPWSGYSPLSDGMRQVFATRTYSREDKRLGLRALGYPETSLEPLVAFEGSEVCTSPHPLARPLDRVAKSTAHAAGDELLDDLQALSSALFESRPEPITVWQVAMESFRADDIHALNPSAPPELTPVMNRLYGEQERVVAFRRMFQGGLRTTQNVAALLCGVGSLPFSIAVGRDFGHFPLRCLPDVLSDATFQPRVFYPSDISYENMLEFFRYHDVKPTQAVDLPRNLPTGSWRGVSDRALYDQALLLASKDRSEYQFVLTMSGHSPFTEPTDTPAVVRERAQQACAMMKRGDADDCHRLGVVAYADFAIGEFLENLERSPLAGRSIVVVSADHATNEPFLWGSENEAKSRAHVPYLVYVPKALAAGAPHPERIATLLGRLAEHAERLNLSLMDSPSLVMALLSATPQVKSIPAGFRFHTFGGQATSPHFAIDARPETRIWGTDAAAHVFFADSASTITVDAKKNPAFSDVSEFDSMNATLRGPAAVLASFVKGYLSRCEGVAPLRMNDHRIR